MADTRRHLVYGPPGTGKTTYIQRQAERAAAKHGAAAVVVASLTRAAAEEVAARTAGGLPRRNVGTLHSFAFRSLDGPTLLDTPEGLRKWNEHAPQDYRCGYTAGRTVDLPPLSDDAGGDAPGTALLSDYSRLRTSCRDDRDRWPGGVRNFARRWEDFKRQTGMVDFCDLIERAARETDHAPGKPAVLFVDEAQDLSALEMRLVRHWSQAALELVTVGDPDQNLYEWRGSDPAVFGQGEAASEIVLHQSHRVPAAVHRYAVGWIEKTPDRKPVKYEPRRDEDGNVVEGSVKRLHSVWRDPTGIVNLAATEAGQERSTMILAPCSYMLAPTISLLRDRGVPFHNPYRPSHGAWNPMAGARRALALLRPQVEVWGEVARPWTWRDVWAWAEPMKAEHFTRGAKTWLESRMETDQFGRTLADDPADLAWLAANVSDAAAMALMAGDLKWWHGSVLASWKGRLEYAVQVAARRGGAELRREPRVCVGTIHSVKGGEADTVVVIPDLSRAGVLAWEHRATRAAMRRLFYVAFTRARERLVLAAPASPMSAPLPAPV